MYSHVRLSTLCGEFAMAAALLAAVPATAPAQSVLFFDDFTGPNLNDAFVPSLPNGAPLGDGSGSCSYLGPGNYSFENLSGASVLRVSNTLNSWQRRGWSATPTFAVNDFRFEVRFNVLVQSPSTSIDSFIETWLIDPSNPDRYSFAGPHGGSFGTSRQFRAGGSIDGQYRTQSSNYLDNAWYRLVIEGGPSQNIRASLLADDGTTELIGRTLAYGASAFPNGFQIGLAQATGLPGAPYPLDVAIDWVRVTTTPVPEPSTVVVGALALGSLALRRRCRMRPRDNARQHHMPAVVSMEKTKLRDGGLRQFAAEADDVLNNAKDISNNLHSPVK